MRTISAALSAAALSACSMAPTYHVSGLDNLKVTEYRLSLPDVIITCAERMGMPLLLALIGPPISCATIILENWTCDIYYAASVAWLSLDHEREHCAGNWHNDGLQNYRDAWRTNKERDL